MVISKVTKIQGFTLSLSLENTFLEKPQRGQIDPLSALLGLKLLQSHMNEATWT